MICIYAITNLLNEKRYIGGSVNFLKRRSEHIRDLNRNRHHAMLGKKLTAEHIAKCIRRGPQHHNFGKPKSPEIRAKISAAKKGKRMPQCGRPCSEEQKQLISQRNKGRVVPLELRRHLSIVLTGRPKSMETRMKMSIAATGVPKSEEHRRHVSEARRGEKHWFFGQRHTDETKRKMSLARHSYWEQRRAA